MNRYPPKEVIKSLRNESNFICSIPTCEIPYLEYHHFDPPWHVKNHHNSDGMIALCPIHHRQADGNTWTNQQLREFKDMNKNETLRNSISGKFNYLRNSFLLYAGGNYFFNNQLAEICIGQRPLLWFEKNDKGLKMLNIVLLDEKGEIYFHIENNSWKVKNNIKDINCPPNGKNLRIDFNNENYIQIEFTEIKTIEALQKNISENHINIFKNLIPITLLKVSLKLKEHKINFQANKILHQNTLMKGCLSSDNKVGLRL